MTPLAIAFVMLLLCVEPLSAGYLDPGTGSFVVQLIAAAVLGGLAAVRSVRERVASWIRTLVGSGSVDESGEADDS